MHLFLVWFLRILGGSDLLVSFGKDETWEGILSFIGGALLVLASFVLK